jgi:Holliday junction resolvasome RuvABC endonuclease subunit
MKGKLIVFCSIVSALMGAVIGLAVAEVSPQDYESSLYANLHVKLALLGAGVGAAAGAGQEVVRQLKEEQEHQS